MAHWQFHYPKRYSFAPSDYEDPGLGGSETAIVLLTRQLACRGHRVEVFNACWNPGDYDGVTWRGAWDLPAGTPDVAVAVRFDEALWDTPATQHLFWMLDDRTRGPAAFTARHPEAPVVVASEAMRDRLAADGITARTVKIGLPIETNRYRPDQRRQRACLYSSMPNRGLDVLLDFWPRIRAQVPDAELWITSGWQLWGLANSEADDRWRQLRGDRTLPDGACRLGPLPRPKLIDRQHQAWLGLYPSRFPEMFCYAAAESAAAGTPMITSARDALVERVHHNRTGILIPGDITAQHVQDQFVDAATTLLTNPALRDRLAGAAHAEAQEFNLNTIAERWEQLVS